MNLNKINTVYFIGIGGIGMSNLVRYLHLIGKKVLGYDKTETPLTDALQSEGIFVRYTIDLNWVLQQNFDKDTTLIVFTPAVKQEEHKELDYFITNGFQVIKRSKLLGLVTKDTICLAVAGTHGKTTTSTLLGHILKDANVPATSFLGGISENYHTNLIVGGATYSVVEADEYDRSFLNLNPDYACITATDADHLDIYSDASDFEKTFKEFAALVSQKVIVRKGLHLKGQTFGIEEDSDYQAKNIRVINGAFVFDVKTPTAAIENVTLNMPGRHNVLNAMAALALADSIGVDLEKISNAIESFKGVERRFSYRIKSENKVLIDDYAHHPTELNALYNAVRELYPDEKLTIVFQPHTFTRTRDFFEGFKRSLAQFDEIYLLPIYAAREHPLDGITSENLANEIQKINSNAHFINNDLAIETIKKNNNKIILMVGAGNIGEMVTEVVNELTNIK